MTFILTNDRASQELAAIPHYLIVLSINREPGAEEIVVALTRTFDSALDLERLSPAQRSA